jgi:hypothetical protein
VKMIGQDEQVVTGWISRMLAKMELYRKCQNPFEAWRVELSGLLCQRQHSDVFLHVLN